MGDDIKTARRWYEATERIVIDGVQVAIPGDIIEWSRAVELGLVAGPTRGEYTVARVYRLGRWVIGRQR